MYPYLFGIQKLPTYGICMIVGFAVAFLLAYFYFSKKVGIPKEDILYGSCFALAFGIAGAKILAILTSIDIIIEYNIPFIDVMRTGFTFYGGFIGGFLGYCYYSRRFNVNLIKLLGTASSVIPIGHAIGRIGCFCAGCCYGKPIDSILGVIFTNPIDPYCPTGIKLLPTQLFEAGYLLVIFLIILVLGLKKDLSAASRIKIYGYSYASCRFLNEYFRYDSERKFLGNLSTSQCISVFIILIMITWTIIDGQKRQLKNQFN